MTDLLHPDEGPDDDEQDEAGLEDGDFVPAGTADDRLEADLLVSACQEAGIPAVVRSGRDGLVGKLSAPVDDLQILVRQTDLSRAQALIAERKTALESDQAGAQKAAEDEEAAGELSAATATPASGTKPS